ncbi:ovochymase-like [Diadema setosum]|uniref:ovochymase-like n=1 Tax=Diadema setosum TaxID=31175 RepID=UPI003B3A2783
MDFFNFVVESGNIQSCHEDFTRFACNLIFPECPHYGPTHRPCLSDCVNITASCRSTFENITGEDWPITCGGLTDSQMTSNGYCRGSSTEPYSEVQCGTRPGYAPDLTQIFRGVEAEEGEFPWMAQLYAENQGGQFCGATLIAADWVVTAAHCVDVNVDLVIFGDLSLSTHSEHRQAIPPAEIITDPYYSYVTPYDRDIALIRLSQPVNYTDFVRPACLADSLQETTDYHRCLIAGWGLVEQYYYPDALQKAVVRLFSQEECKDFYGESSITPHMICAGYERGEIDSCSGDSGGPLVCQGINGRWQLIGVTSWGDGCAVAEKPGVYTRVSQYYSVIVSFLNGSGNFTGEWPPVGNVTAPPPYVGETSTTMPSVSNSSVIYVNLSAGETIVLESPMYPNYYPNNAGILWFISIPEDYSLLIDFLDFSTEAGYDYLVIGSGLSPEHGDSLEIARYDGDEIPDDLRLLVTNAWIHFTSDGSVTEQGFQLELRVDTIGCQPNATACGRTGLCLSQDKLCDGYNDCGHFEDEEYCPICSAVPEVCSTLPYDTTFFPNGLFFLASDAMDFMNLVVSGNIQSCHEDFMRFACNVIFPACPHYGPTHRPCLSDCVNITASCRSTFESIIGEDWPITCGGLTDSQMISDGYCRGNGVESYSAGECGTRPAYAPDLAQVFRGVNAEEGEFPWMAQLYTENLGGHFCGATLIASDWVVTAAHCVDEGVDLVILGDLSVSTPSEHRQAIPPAEIITDPYYSYVTAYDRDIALIRLSQPVNYTDFVRPACLADSLQETTDYHRCLVAGWGLVEQYYYPDALQKAVVRLFSQEDCEDFYGESSITPHMICAGYERGEIDTCSGDSGGPLVCQGNNGRWHLVGVTSWGDGCAVAGKPGVYARASQYYTTIISLLIGKFKGEWPSVEGVTAPPPNVTETDIMPNTSIIISFLDFETESHFDILEIGNGLSPSDPDSYVIGLYGGTFLPADLRLASANIWIRFSSDPSLTFRGFQLRLRAYFSGPSICDDHTIVIDQTAVCDLRPDCLGGSDEKDCNTKLSIGDHIYLPSHNYPDFYPPNAYVLWTFQYASGTNESAAIYQILFGYVSLGSNDYLRVGYGWDPDSSTVRYYGSNYRYYTYPLVMQARDIYVVFESDASEEARSGFQMELIVYNVSDVFVCSDSYVINITQVCDDHRDCNDGGDENRCATEVILDPKNSTILQSVNYPQYYPNNANQLWSITVPSNYSVIIKFLDFSLERNYDFLDIGNGPGPWSFDSYLIARYDGHYLPDALGLRSAFYQLLRSTARAGLAGPNLELGLDRDAPQSPIKTTSYTVLSPGMRLYLPSHNYPSYYPPNAYVLWTFQSFEFVGNESTVIYQILFGYVYLGAYDYLTVGYGWDPDNSYIRYFGSYYSGYPIPLILESKDVFVEFRADDYSERSGFNLELSVFNTSGTTLSSGMHLYLSSHNYPGYYPENAYVLWTFQYEHGGNDSTIVYYISFGYVSLGSGDYLTVGYGWDPYNSVVRRYGSYYYGEPPPLILQSGDIFVEFDANGYSQRYGFRLELQIVNTSGKSETDHKTTPFLFN